MDVANITNEITTVVLAFNRQYLTILVGYIEPLFILVGTSTNFLSIIGIFRARRGISPSMRFYYLMMTIFDFIDIVCYLYTPFFKETLPIWLHQSNANTIASNYAFLSKLCNVVWAISEMLSDYALLILTLERTYALLFPFKARQFFGLRFSLTFYFIVVSPMFLITIPSVAWASTIIQDPFLSTNGYMSEPSVASAPLVVTMIAVYGYGVCINGLPPIVGALCVPILTYKIVSASRTRKELARTKHDTTKFEIVAAIVTLQISLVNLVIFLPNAVTWIMFLYRANQPFYDISELILLGALVRTGLEALVIPHTINFYIFWWRLPAFRAALLPCPGHRGLDSTAQSDKTGI